MGFYFKKLLRGCDLGRVPCWVKMGNQQEEILAGDTFGHRKAFLCPWGNRRQLRPKLWSTSLNSRLRALTELCQGCEIIGRSLGTEDLSSSCHPFSPAFLYVAVPRAAMSPARLVIRMFIHSGLVLSANLDLRHPRETSKDLYILVLYCLCIRRNVLDFRNFTTAPCSESRPSLLLFFPESPPRHLIYLGPGEVRTKVSPLGPNNLLQLAYSNLRFWSESVRTCPINSAAFPLV